MSQGRGLVDCDAIYVNTGAFGAEAVLLTIPAATYHNGRAYRWEWQGKLSSSVANLAICRVHLGTTTAGATIGQNINFNQTGAGVGDYRYAFGEFVRTAGTDITTSINFTLQASAGTVTVLGLVPQGTRCGFAHRPARSGDKSGAY